MRHAPILLVFALALVMSAPLAAEPGVVEQADAWARFGAYGEADRLYAQALEQARDPAEQVRLTYRRLAVAEARNDLPSLSFLAGRLQQLLAKSPDPEVELRLHLALGASAYRTGQMARARQQYGLAEPLAGRLSGMGAALGLYECGSYRYLSGLYAGPAPSPSDYKAAFTRAYEPVTRTPAGPGTWPLDTARSSLWGREWVARAAQYSLDYFYRQQLEPSGAWATVTYEMGEGGSQAMAKAWAASKDPELGYASLHLRLEMAEDCPAATGAETWLSQSKELLDWVETLARPYPDISYEEQAHAWGRYHRARARWLFWKRQNYAEALVEYDQAASWFEKAHRPLEQVDVLLEVPYYALFLNAPADWGSRSTAALQSALTRSNELAYPRGRFLALAYTGKLKAAGNDLAGAEASLRQALEQLDTWLIESGESAEAKRRLLESNRWLYDLLVDVLIRQNRQSEAMDVTQRMAAQSEVASLDLSRVSARTSAVKTALRSVEETRQQGEQLRAQLQSARSQGQAERARELDGLLARNTQEFYTALNTLRQDPDYSRLVNVRPTAFAKLQPKLGPDVLLVEYFEASDKVFLFVASQKELKIYTSPVGRDSLDQQVQGVRREIQNSVRSGSGELPAATRDHLQGLYRALVAPLQADLAGKKVLAIVPSGCLHYLPFAALVDEQGQFLTQKVGLAYLTSTEIVDLGGPAPEKPQSLVALANPDGSLPGARREVEALAPLFPSQKTYFEGQASKQVVLQPVRAAVLHLATHGVLDPNDVNQSYLLLAGSTADSRLTTGEIYGLQLQGVSLVTLSACQTALGDRQPGAEIANLAQAFSVAGSRSLLASLWKVDDEGTARLMAAFYQGLTAGKPRAESLRAAQLSMLQDPRTANPFYWASFILIGEWR